MSRNKEIAKPYCPYCGGKAELIDSSEVYQSSYGMMWICRKCDAYTGVHKSSKRFAPLGTLANKDLRRLRQQVHSAFDPLWRSKKMTRTEAYALLSRLMGISQDRCHVAFFRDKQCKEALEKLKAPF